MLQQNLLLPFQGLRLSVKFIICLISVFAFQSVMSQVVKRQSEFCKFSQERLFETNVQVFNLGPTINTRFSEYNSVFKSDESYMLYTSRNDTTTGEEVYSKDLQYFEDIMISEFDGRRFVNGLNLSEKPELFPYIFNSEKHEAPVFLSEDDSLFILFKEDKLWYSMLSDTGYLAAAEYSKSVNIKDYHRHASISPIDSVIYFSVEVMDRKSGRNHYDIYQAKLDAKGQWKNPKPLSDKINTLYHEDSPIISEDGKSMYFSSAKPGGLGGFDIYYTEKEGDDWSEPINLCEPINSEGDDIYFSMSNSDNYAYFSSNRLGGFGKFDLYKLVIPKADFSDCTPMSQGKLITLDLSDGVDKNGVELEYEWDLGDGTKEAGIKIDHLYTKPGSFDVSLTAYDPVLGAIYPNQYDTTLVIEFESGSVILNTPDTVGAGERFWVDGSSSKLEGKTPDLFYWSIDTSILQAVNKFQHQFDEPGTFEVKINAMVVNKEFIDLSAQCLVKKIEVLTPELFAEYKERTGFASEESDLYEINESKIELNNQTSAPGIKLANDFENTQMTTPVLIYPLSNDKADGKTLSLKSNTEPKNGSVKMEGNTFIYTPSFGFKGVDQFTYTAKTEGGLEAIANVVITVKSETDFFEDHEAKNIYAAVDSENRSELVIPGFDELTKLEQQQFLNENTPKNGTITVLDSAAGKLLYTANAGFEGKESVVYQVTDEDGFVHTAVAQVKVGKQTDVATMIDIKTTKENTPVAVYVFTNDNFSGLQNIPFELASVSRPKNGLVKIINKKKGIVLYTPKRGFVGSDACVYTVSYGGQTTTEAINILVEGDRKESTLKALPDLAETMESVPVSVSLLDNDASESGKAIKVSKLQEPINGIAEITDATAGLIVFTPNAGFTGTEVFNYTIIDSEGARAKSTVTIKVEGELPIASVEPEISAEKPMKIVDEPVKTVETPVKSVEELVDSKEPVKPDTPLETEIPISYDIACVDDIYETTVDVPLLIQPLENDSHAKKRKFKIESLTQPENGKVTIDSKEYGRVMYIPEPGFTGEDQFTYEVIDAQGKKARAIVTMRVLPQFEAKNVDMTNVATVELEPIYFDFDKSFIRQSEIATMTSNIQKLKDNPNAVIKVVSHCDSRGTDGYNVALSNRRAKSTVDYLVKHGISPSRIIAVLGMGEFQLSTPCGNGVWCPPKDHQINRRSDFVLVGTLK
jgi:outer membrane protein OmpA-like peptidoglycan-associated protein